MSKLLLIIYYTSVEDHPLLCLNYKLLIKAVKFEKHKSTKVCIWYSGKGQLQCAYQQATKCLAYNWDMSFIIRGYFIVCK